MKKGSVVSEKKKESVLAGFKAFLMRGNVVDLAVAVVIGAAFTNIVNSVVKGIINPVVGAFGTKDLESYSSCIKDSCVVVDGEVRVGRSRNTALASRLAVIRGAALVPGPGH